MYQTAYNCGVQNPYFSNQYPFQYPFIYSEEFKNVRNTLPRKKQRENRNKTFFVHNPKTGGSSIVDALDNRKGRNDDEYLYIDGWNHHTTSNKANELVIIRDPYNRFKSAITFIRTGRHKQLLDGNNPYQAPVVFLRKFPSFKMMMENITVQELIKNVLNADLVFWDQHNWIGKKSDVLCFENGVQSELNKYLQNKYPNFKPLVLPQKNVRYSGNEDDEYWRDSDNIVKNIVDSLYEKDLKLYKKFCSNVN